MATLPPGSGLRPVLGTYGFLFLGHLVTAIADPLEFARERYRALRTGLLGRRCGLPGGGRDGPQALEAVWVNRDKAFSSTRGWQPVIGPFFDRGIMLLDFEEHRTTGGSCSRRSPAAASTATCG